MSESPERVLDSIGEPAKRRPGRPRKAPLLQSVSVAIPEPMMVSYSLRGAKETHSFRCSERTQEGPFLVFVSREGWQERRFYVAISEIATLDVVGHPQLVGVPVGAAPSRPVAASVIPPNVIPAAQEDHAAPPGSYSAAATFKEMQARAMMLKSDSGSMRSTVLSPDGGLEVVGAAWLSEAPGE